jgi:Ca-activated chloride channel family protein
MKHAHLYVIATFAALGVLALGSLTWFGLRTMSENDIIVSPPLPSASSTVSSADEWEFVEPERGGVWVETDGERSLLPLLHTDVRADVQGDLATVRVRQEFENPSTDPVHAQYTFPLHHDAAVFAMTMRVGDEVIRASIEQVEEAQQQFEVAKHEGKVAALLQQQRPNVFTQDIANLAPGLPIEVTLEYVQTVPKVDDDYALVVPLVVGPRFHPAPTELEPDSALGLLQQVFTPGPGDADHDRVFVEVNLDAGMPIHALNSPSHTLDVEVPSAHRRLLRLAQHRVPDDRDFILRYRLADRTIAAGVLSHHDEQGTAFSLLIEPPPVPAEHEIVPRELVFVLDCSGSMAGAPMDASKAFMHEALAGLRPSDYFRIIRFSDAATEFSNAPLPATPGNIARGRAYVDALEGQGGTHMTQGFAQALRAAVPGGAIRLVVLLTDGYIGNEQDVLSRVQRDLAETTRLYAFGVGTAVNRYLLAELAHVGRGEVRYVDPTEDVHEVAVEAAARIASPVLTDVTIDWGALEATELTPDPIPDLFAGRPVRVQGRTGASGDHTITVSGRQAGRRVELPLQVSLPAPGSRPSDRGRAVTLIWARSTIADLMREMSHPRAIASPPAQERLERGITDLGLQYALVTPYTAFVAVSEHVYADPRKAHDVQVSTPRPAGMQPLPASPANHGTPEVSEWIALIMVSAAIVLLMLGVSRRRVRESTSA